MDAGWLLRSMGELTLSGLSLGLGVLYLEGVFRKPNVYRLTDTPSPADPRFFKALPGLSDSMSTSGHVTGYWDDIDAIYEARIAAIAGARERVHFETYYMTPGRRADAFADALCAAIARGVTVQMIVDAQGTGFMPRAYWQRLRDAGVKLRFFRCFQWQAPLDYLKRTHRKLLIADGEVALVGGVGVSDEWDGRPAIGDTGPWRDLEIRVAGRVVSVLEGKFLQEWAAVGGTVSLDTCNFHDGPGDDPPMLVTTGSYAIDSSDVRMLFHACVEGAERRIWLASPYFMPDRVLRRALVEAKHRGLDVRILTMGPANDRHFVYEAGRELYKDLLEVGIEVWEYQPSLMHAKLMLVDEQWVTTGSANMDPLSLFENEELDISMTDPRLAKRVERFFTDSFAVSQRISLADWRARGRLQHLTSRFWLFFRQLL